MLRLNFRIIPSYYDVDKMFRKHRGKKSYILSGHLGPTFFPLKLEYKEHLLAGSCF